MALLQDQNQIMQAYINQNVGLKPPTGEGHNGFQTAGSAMRGAEPGRIRAQTDLKKASAVKAINVVSAVNNREILN